ncbi:MAG: glycosyltransferase family 4 protein [Nitrospinae bacterium]|nr:glycosyltransferase family 4 protein [Nitrospinota bacterium]
MAVKKVVIVEAAGKGKLSQSAYSLCCALAEYGCDVTLITAKDYELDNLPAKFEIVKLFSDKNSIRIYFDFLSAAALIRKIKPDIVHFKWFPSAAIGFAFLKLLRRAATAKLVYTPGNILPHRNRFAHVKWWAGIYNEMDAIIAHSDYCKDVLADIFEIDSARIQVVPDYVCFDTLANLVSREEARLALGMGHSEKIALFIGYLNKGKSIENLVSAFAMAKCQVPEAKLVIAGQPVEGCADPLELATRGNLDKDVHFDLRYVPFLELLRYLAACDAVVLPYSKISQSPVHRLAAAFGKPVVSLEMAKTSPDYLSENTAVENPASRLALAMTEALSGRGGAPYGKSDQPPPLSWDQVAAYTCRAYSIACGHA